MEKVYFSRNFGKLKESTEKMLSKVFYRPGKILVKLHFGEGSNQTAFTPTEVEPIILALKQLGLEPWLIDSPVAYDSARKTVAGYTEEVKKRGFDKIAPFIISNDSVISQAKDFEVGIIKELTVAENVLVLSHVKGHPCSGFGGAIKNLAMGGVDVETKSREHSLCKPSKAGKCLACEQCVNLCPAKAMEISNDEVQFDLDKCWGCSICQEVCPQNCLKPKVATFDDLLAQAGVAVKKHLPPRTFYINTLKNITQSCDCGENSGPIISSDIGILFSSNLVAIDKASLDLILKVNGIDIFKITNHKDPLKHVKLAAKYSDEDPDYELVEI